MDILIESTKRFETDLNELSQAEKALAIEKINDCASLFSTQQADSYCELFSLSSIVDINGYESSLHTLEISHKLRAILAVDEDPIFEQVILTFFRVVKHDELDKACRGVAESLYRDFLHHKRKAVKVS